MQTKPTNAGKKTTHPQLSESAFWLRRLDAPLVGLSDIDVNKYNAVLRFKHSISESPQLYTPTKSIAPETRKVNEHGEIVVNKIRCKQKNLSEDEISALIVDYNEGKTTYELAEKFDCHRYTVSSALKRNGVDVSKAKAQRKLSVPEAISMYENMHTTAEIAEKFNVSTATILQCLHSNGIKIRSRWDY